MLQMQIDEQVNRMGSSPAPWLALLAGVDLDAAAHAALLRAAFAVGVKKATRTRALREAGKGLEVLVMLAGVRARLQAKF